MVYKACATYVWYVLLFYAYISQKVNLLMHSSINLKYITKYSIINIDLILEMID
jgi:hypothetical protein